MEKYADMKLKIEETGAYPENTSAEQFLAMLPKDYKVQIKLGEDLTGFTIELPGDAAPRVDYDTWAFLRGGYRDILKCKSNIPASLIDGWYNLKIDTHEELAYSLRFYFDNIRQTEGSGRGPNVIKSVTRSEINFVARDMLSSVLEDDYPMLLDLVTELLDVDRTYEKILSNNAPVKRDDAYRMRVTYPDVSIRKIAEVLEVSPSTVSRWMNADDAEEKLKIARHSALNIAMFADMHPDFSNQQLAVQFQVEESYILESLDKIRSFRDKTNRFMKEKQSKRI